MEAEWRPDCVLVLRRCRGHRGRLSGLWLLYSLSSLPRTPICADDDCSGSPACKVEEDNGDNTNSQDNETAVLPGCMDMGASNYDEEATEDDGSCNSGEEYVKFTGEPCLVLLDMNFFLENNWNLNEINYTRYSLEDYLESDYPEWCFRTVVDGNSTIRVYNFTIYHYESEYLNDVGPLQNSSSDIITDSNWISMATEENLFRWINPQGEIFAVYSFNSTFFGPTVYSELWNDTKHRANYDSGSDDGRCAEGLETYYCQLYNLREDGLNTIISDNGNFICASDIYWMRPVICYRYEIGQIDTSSGPATVLFVREHTNVDVLFYYHEAFAFDWDWWPQEEN